MKIANQGSKALVSDLPDDQSDKNQNKRSGNAALGFDKLRLQRYC